VGTTFVGRANELAALAEARTRAAGARRQLVVVTGAAGIGKTWFCEQAAAAAEHDGFEVVWGRCWPHGGAPALWPWPAMLPALAGTADLLAADSGDARVDPERFARFAAVAERLARTRARTPTMIVIDDAQHADESALLLTRFLTAALDRIPLLVVLARRVTGERAQPLLDELARDANTIALRPFDLTDTAALLVAHGVAGADPEVVRTLHQVTAGSPLHLAQAVHRGWTESGPATLEQAVTDAIDRLSAPQQRILAFAALLGVDGAIGEIAGLAGDSSAAVLDALSTAAGAGLVELTRDGCRFHDLVRQVAAGRLGTAEQLDAHARAATLLAGTGQDERVAQHALAAAVRSDPDAERAIGACRTAAVSLRRGYAYEPAADLLDRAVSLAEHRPELPDRAGLLVERAEAVLACGRLIDARTAFEAAAGAAEDAGDPVLTARAVLGLGGVWVHEHRHPSVRQHVLARQRAALSALPAAEGALRRRLAVRLAAEAAYEGEPVAAVLDALADLRSLGDPGALADALSLTHHALLAPEHATRRLPLAEEQIAVASAAGDGILALFGLLWRTADLYLLGDPDAGRSLTELRQRSAALGVATVDYIIACMDVMRLLRAGRLEEAAEAAGPCLRLGLEVGDADATGYYGAQLLAIRWFQGRDDELADLVSGVVASASLAVVEFGFRVSVVMVLARGGRVAEARAALEPLREHGIAALPRSSTWLAAMVGLVEAGWLLDDPGLVAEAADLIRPFAALPVMPSLAVSCFGSAERALGRAALVAGEAGAAVAHLERAVEANLRLDHRPAAALSRAELAEALTVRAAPGDRARARAELAEAIDEARAMEMAHRVETWTARAAALAPPVLARHRDGWTVTGGSARVDLPDIVGLHYLSRLLEHPGTELSAVDLCGTAVVAGRQELLDSTAIDAYRQRVRDLDAAIDDADAGAGAAKADQLRLERDAVVGELTRALGLGGRSRQFAATPERARTAVRKAIKRALDAIADREPALGADLRAGITTGTVCRYTPSGLPWRVESTSDSN
jgi:tetratricopeptide (TPR) repeat protein